jgi:ATP-binding cassette subfamily C protein CydD
MANGSTTDGKAAAKLWLKAESRHGRKAAWPVVIVGLFGTACAVGQAYCVALVLGAALTTGAGAVLLPGCAGFAVLALLRVLAQMIGERYAFAAGAAARRRLRSDALSRLLHAGPVVLGGRHSGDLAGIVVDKVEALDGLFANWLPASNLALAAPLLVIVVAFFADPYAALVLFCAGLLVPIGMAAAGIGAATAFRRQFLALSRLQARFLDRVRGIATIILAGRAADEAAALADAAAELRRRTMRVLRVAFLSSTALDLAAAAALILIVIHFAHLLRGNLAIAPAALFVLLLVPEFFAPLRNFAAVYQDRMAAEAVAEDFSNLPEPPAPVPPAEIRTVAAQGLTLAFEDVTFAWDPARGPVLENLSFRVIGGDTLLLTGASGSGKSTIIDLILGFIEPASGKVTFNGAELKTLVPAAREKLIAWIGQKPMIFGGTILDNIKFAKPEASAEEINGAVKRARLTEVIAALPLGLETVIGETGFGLSGGQAQRIAIARAFLKDAPLLLLDEPTAHLDPAIERDVLESLKRLAIGRTVILATHSTLAQEFARDTGARKLDLDAIRHARLRGVA